MRFANSFVQVTLFADMFAQSQVLGSGQKQKLKLTCIKDAQRCTVSEDMVRWMEDEFQYVWVITILSTASHGMHQHQGMDKDAAFPFKLWRNTPGKAPKRSPQLSPTLTHRGQATFSGPSLPPEDQAHSWL